MEILSELSHISKIDPRRKYNDESFNPRLSLAVHKKIKKIPNRIPLRYFKHMEKISKQAREYILNRRRGVIIQLNDKKLAVEMVSIDGKYLMFASKKLQNDREVVLTAVKSKGWALQYASKNLQNDREIVLEAVKINAQALQFASESLRDDREIVLEAVKTDGAALHWASYRLQDDREIVIIAMASYLLSFSFVSQRLRKDKELKKLYFEK